MQLNIAKRCEIFIRMIAARGAERLSEPSSFDEQKAVAKESVRREALLLSGRLRVARRYFTLEGSNFAGRG